VLAQQGAPLEIIVVDDASTDGTGEWLAGLTDLRLRVITYDSPRGVSAARNDAIDAATGGWVAFLDDDDFWAPTYLSSQLAHAARTDAVVAAASAVVVDTALNPLYTLRAPADEPDVRRALFRNNIVGGPSRVMVRTQALRDLEGFDRRLAILADWDLWIALVRRAHLALNVEPLVAVTQHERNMQLVEVGHIVDEIEYIREKHAEYAASIEAVFGGEDLYRWLAAQYRRAGRKRQAAGTYVMIARQYREPQDLLRGVASITGAHHWTARRRRRPKREELPHWLLATGPVSAGK
jgi:glycosyltransferase involved in cell wall biosynthesis